MVCRKAGQKGAKVYRSNFGDVADSWGVRHVFCSTCVSIKMRWPVTPLGGSGQVSREWLAKAGAACETMLHGRTVLSFAVSAASMPRVMCRSSDCVRIKATHDSTERRACTVPII